jgi:hypothetical protein
MASMGPELDLELLTSRKDKVLVPKGIHNGMRFFMCESYEHDPLPPCRNVRPKVRTNCITK